MKNSFWKKITSAFRTKSFRIGGYSVLSLVVVLAIAVMANVLVDTLPGSWTQLDMTDSKLYSLSAQTKNIVSSLEQDVTIYWIVQQGKEESMVETLLSRYEDLSDRIRIVKKDPDIYPTFAQQYTDGGVYNNSIVVESDLRSSYISANDFYEYDYSSYYMTGKYDVSFAGENALTSAISYVASEELPIIYTIH
jgi:ABC-2 type transport system permease protein